MRRRTFIGGFTVLLPVLGGRAQGQVATRSALLVLLWGGVGLDEYQRSIEEGLQALGYVKGQHYVMEVRAAEGVISRLPALAREVVGLKPDVARRGRPHMTTPCEAGK